MPNVTDPLSPRDPFEDDVDVGVSAKLLRDEAFPRPFGVELAERDRARVMPEPTLAEAMEDCPHRTLGQLRLTRDLCWEAWEEHEAPRYWYRWRCACVVLAHLFPGEVES